MSTHFSILQHNHQQRQIQKKMGYLVTDTTPSDHALMGRSKSTQGPSKSQDEIAFHTKSYGYNSLAPNASSEVRTAWQQAEQIAGVKAGSLEHLSSLFSVQSEQQKLTGNTDVLGKTTESAIAAVKKALANLESNSGTKVNTKVQEYRQQEKTFYQAFLALLS